jgi:plastocyanin
MQKLLAVVVLIVTLFAACGDDGGRGVATAPADRTTDATAPRIDGRPDGTAAGDDCEDAAKGGGPADIEMQDFSFAPRCLEITTDQGLRLHNEGDREHNWSVEGVSGLDVDVSAGDENNTEATGLMPGTFTFFCKYHRERYDMEGALVVKSA